MDAKPALPFHMKVRVRSKRPVTKEIDGRLGCVAGITEQPDEYGNFGYGILVYDLERVWCCDEDELKPTGELDNNSVERAEAQARRLALKAFGQL
jgi:hypothetical protein